MYYIIDDIKNLENGGLYAIVRFWPNLGAFEAGDLPTTNDFYLPRLQATERRIVKDERGWYRTVGGEWIDYDHLDPEEPEPEYEWEFGWYDIPVKDILVESVESHWKRRLAAGNKWSKQDTDHRIVNTLDDPRGLRTPDVMALKGVGRERPDVYS